MCNFLFEDVNVMFLKKLVEICVDVGVCRLVYVSVLGVEEDYSSAYYRLKVVGEAAVWEVFFLVMIVWLVKIVGVEDRFLNIFGEYLCKYLVVFIIDGGDIKY